MPPISGIPLRERRPVSLSQAANIMRRIRWAVQIPHFATKVALGGTKRGVRCDKTKDIENIGDPFLINSHICEVNQRHYKSITGSRRCVPPFLLRHFDEFRFCTWTVCVPLSLAKGNFIRGLYSEVGLQSQRDGLTNSIALQNPAFRYHCGGRQIKLQSR